MKIEYDPAKRLETLIKRELDMADVALVFDGPTKTYEDLRKDYGETRYIMIGFFADRMVLIAWINRGDARRIISFRRANDREIAGFLPDVRSGFRA